MPGIIPSLAYSRKQIRQSPKSRINPCARPQRKQRLTALVENLGVLLERATTDVLAIFCETPMKYRLWLSASPFSRRHGEKEGFQRSRSILTERRVLVNRVVSPANGVYYLVKKNKKPSFSAESLCFRINNSLKPVIMFI